jgi:Rrf2 family protein
MILSNTATYVIRVLSLMATDQNKQYTADFLIEKLDISDKYLRRLMTQLSKAGLIKSIRGRGGGYVFAKPIDSIFLVDIINAVEESDKYTGCILGFSHCSDDNPCVLHNQWAKIKEEIMEMLSTTSLQMIIENNKITRF